MRVWWVLLLALGACGNDTGRIINVAPSAEGKMDDISEAVERLNRLTGEETFILRVVDSDERIDGEVILRVSDELGQNDAHETRIGNTKRTPKGVIVRVVQRATPCAIAHELGHAAGLQHVNDEHNLMYRETSPNRWHLNEDQLEHLRDPLLL